MADLFHRGLAGIEDLHTLARLAFAQFDQAFAQAPIQLRRAVGRLVFDLRTTQADQAALMLERVTSTASLAPPDVRLLVVCGTELGLPGVPRLRGAWTDELSLEQALSRTPWRMHHHPESGLWQLWDVTQRRGLQWMAGPQALPPWDTGSPLRNLLKWALTTPDQGLLHAGVLAVNGRGLLLVGQGGSGKSSTVLAGLRDGLDSVGDDYVLVAADASGVQAKPLFNTLKCDPLTLQRLGLSERSDITGQALNWQGKHEFTVQQFTRRNHVHSVEIVGLCMPRIRHGDASHFEPASPKAAFLALAPTGIAQLPGDRGSHFHLCARITRQLPCHQLHLGNDPGKIVQVIRRFLREEGPPC